MSNIEKNYDLRCETGLAGCGGACSACGFNAASAAGGDEYADEPNMAEVVGVRFRPTGKAYYFDPNGAKLERGGAVIVETQRGVDYGVVEFGNRRVRQGDLSAPLKKILRQATKADEKQLSANKEREREMFAQCAEKVTSHKLDMKLIGVDLSFDRTKVVFYFTADGRVDFRDLVKDLAGVFRMRIELRQIGVRDEARLLSGIGACGRELCCAKFLDDFQPVSIKMVKDQGISPNPAKISGSCGRLLCCLKYEEATYEQLGKDMPGVGDTVRTPDGDGDVLTVSVLKQQVRVAVRNAKGDDVNAAWYEAADIKILKRDPNNARDDEPMSDKRGGKGHDGRNRGDGKHDRKKLPE